MMNYPIPASKDKSFEEVYQRLVANALRTATREPILVAPRSKYRGWSWTVYTRR